MGIRRKIYYTIECNHCGKMLEDDVGELTGITEKKERVFEIAESSGWFCIGKDSWRCTDCKEDWNK